MGRIEKRKFKRLKNGVKVIFKILNKREETVLSINIGAGGVCIPLKEKIEPGTFLELGLILPDQHKPFYAFAKVAWQAKVPKRDEKGDFYYETGIHFLRMNLEERKKLIEYVYTRSKNKK